MQHVNNHQSITAPRAWNQQLGRTSLAQLSNCSFTFSIDNDFPVPGHPHMYRLPAFLCSTHPLQNSKTTFCSSSRHTTEHGAVDKCNASFTAFICSPSIIKSTKKIRIHHYKKKRQWERKRISNLTFGIPLGFHSFWIRLVFIGTELVYLQTFGIPLGFHSFRIRLVFIGTELVYLQTTDKKSVDYRIERDERASVGELGFSELHWGRNWRLPLCIGGEICGEAMKGEIATCVLRR